MPVNLNNPIMFAASLPDGFDVNGIRRASDKVFIV